MEIKQKGNLRYYKFCDLEENILCNCVALLMKDNKADILHLQFKQNKFNKSFWKKIEMDLLTNDYYFIFFLLKENMNDFDIYLNKYKSLGFQTDYKKLPIAVYYKNDEVYRIISLYIKKNKKVINKLKKNFKKLKN